MGKMEPAFAANRPDTVKGRFVRQNARFRNWITADGSAGPSGTDGFKAEADRYHLYVSHACPWAHRTVLFRKLKGLEAMISLSVVHWHMGPEGWRFTVADGATGDPVNHAELLREIYFKADPGYDARYTVPVLWDKRRNTIVSNESSEIIRMFNAAFDHLGATPGDYYPEALQDEIDALNERNYHTVNNGVYRGGFASSQEAHEEAVTDLFDSLDWLDDRLAGRRYLTGPAITEADWRLFTTLLRFDAVYHGHFKCNLRRIADYPHLSGYLRDLYQRPGVRETVHMDHIKKHYYVSHESINPRGLVPLGPILDLDAPHGRDAF